MQHLTLRRFTATCGLALGLVAGPAAQADWTLDSDISSIQFITTKNSAVAEVHRFKKLSGSIDSSGAGKVEIALDSVDTLVAIRNERMRELLFQTATFPNAVIGTQVDLDILEQLPVGAEQVVATSLAVSLHGNEAELPAKLRVSALGNGRYVVTTAQPLLLRASDFDLADGIEQLRGIAGLDSISTAVPVTVYLVWKS